MTTIQISKIQLRRGPASDLPGVPDLETDPPTYPAALDDGELGFANDEGRLFIGAPNASLANASRIDFPYRNVEVLTEFSPLTSTLHGDNQAGFIGPATMAVSTGSPPQAQTLLDASGNPYDLGFTNGANTIIRYYIFDSDNNPVRSGTLTVFFSPASLSGLPLWQDDTIADLTTVSEIQWSITTHSSITETNVLLQYINQTDGPLSVWFNLERPFVVVS